MDDFIQEDIDNEKLLSRNYSKEERNQTDVNIRKLDELLRINYDKSVEEFSEVVLCEIAEITGSLRAAFYTVDYVDDIVAATAAYGTSLKGMKKKEFKIGEDLIGYSVKSKKSRYIENLPVNNSTISTGLTQISFSSLLISPLIFNDIVYGVLELNNTGQLNELILTNIETLSRNIASTLQSIINNAKTKKLLSELQEKTNEMEAQEEELRQNMEELAATRDEMERQRDELEANNQKMQDSERILRKAFDDAKDSETELKKKTKEYEKQAEALDRFKQKLNRLSGDVVDEDVTFYDLFDIDEVQKLQDAFAAATGVGSIITEVNGTPITKGSNFSHLCANIIRPSKKGGANCMKSDALLGKQLKGGVAARPCLNGGLIDGGAGIYVGDRQIAIWLAGQVFIEETDEEKFMEVADEIEVDREEFKKGLKEITRMSREQFEAITNYLFISAQQMSKYALQNYNQAKEIAKHIE